MKRAITIDDEQRINSLGCMSIAFYLPRSAYLLWCGKASSSTQSASGRKITQAPLSKRLYDNTRLEGLVCLTDAPEAEELKMTL